MIKLTSLNDLIVSLIAKTLGNRTMTFYIYPDGKSDLLMEFESEDYKFTVSVKPVSSNKRFLKVYDNGNVYLIPDIFPDKDDFLEESDYLIREEASALSSYYSLNSFRQTIGKNLEAYVYVFIKDE
jgi:hypothetical protein